MKPRRPRAAILSVAYLVTVIAVVIVTSRLGDKYWLPTAMLFAPRWVHALPILVLLPLGAISKGPRRIVTLASCAVAALVLVWFNDVHFSASAFIEPPQGPKLRVMSYNIGGGTFNPGALVSLIAYSNVDVVGLPECQLVDHDALKEKGYTVKTDPSGMCLVTRLPIVLEDIRDPHDMWDVGGSGVISRYELDWSGHRFSVLLVHLETVREGLEELRSGVGRPGWKGPAGMRANIAQREHESRLAVEWSRHAGVPQLVMGDFNIPTDSAIYRSSWGGFHNALSEQGNGHLVTKATRWHGIRIDHILFSAGWKCHRAWIAEDLGMDHRPVVAEFTWTGL